MKSKYLLILFFMTFMIVGAAPNASAIEVSGSASIGAYSEYVWRGITFSKDWVAQSYLEQSYKGVSLNIWTNYDSDMGEINEVDWTLSYSKSFDKLGVNAGYAYYGVDTWPDYSEVYLSLSYDTLLSPSLTFYHQVLEGEGNTLIAAIGHSMTVNDKLTLNLGASANYNMKETVMGTDKNGKRFNGLYNGEVSLSGTYQLNEEITIEPKIAYTTSLSDDAEDAIIAINQSVGSDNDDSVVYGGVAVTVSF